MEVVLRPVNDRFLHEVAFPAFEQGVVDAAAGLELLKQHLADERTSMLVELLLASGVRGSFFSLEEEKWVEIVYRLLFWEWVERGRGWVVGRELAGFAGDFEQLLHLSLMLEQANYPYFDPPQAKSYREAVLKLPEGEGGLTQLLCGLWDPPPSFPPDQVLSTAGRGIYRPAEGFVLADWSYRPLEVVNAWGAQLPNKLSRLLGRESRRLHPVEVPESHEILEYWLGHTDWPPTLSVAFSGLGPTAHEWIRDIGALARLVRQAAAEEQGLTVILTERGRAMADGAPGED